jgi:hypothetical protein
MLNRKNEIRDDKVVMLKEDEGDRSSRGNESSEGEYEVRMKELLDYAFDGNYHEAGHAIVRAYLGMPFISVTVQVVEGVHAGYTDVVPSMTTTYQESISVAMFTAAGRVATDIYTELNPEMTRFHDSDRADQQAIDAQAQQIRTELGIDPEEWKAAIVARTAAILRIPYVWAAVEELAWQLLETEGEYAIPAKEVYRILRKAKATGQ